MVRSSKYLYLMLEISQWVVVTLQKLLKSSIFFTEFMWTFLFIITRPAAERKAFFFRILILLILLLGFKTLLVCRPNLVFKALSLL